MPPADESSQPPRSAEPFHEKLRGKLTEYAVLALPIALINALVLWLMSKFFNQPWHALSFVIPLVILGAIVWKSVISNPSLALGRSFLVLLGLYTLVFCIMAGAEFLNWRRTLYGYEQQVPRNFLSLNWAGDWRYALAPQSPIKTDFATVIMPAPQNLEDGRFDDARLISMAVGNGAKGIAFDYYFIDNADPRIDEFLCAQIKNADTAKVPVLVGYGIHFNDADPEPIRDPIASNLQSCLPNSNQGHILGYLEADGKTRMVPMYFKGDVANESLSLRVSRLLQQDIQAPDDGLLQFVKAGTDYPEIKYENLISDANQRGRLRDKFLLVGRHSAQDTFKTPYGDLPGIVIHALAIHSLRQHHFLKRLPWWSSFLILFVSCYLIVLFFAQEWRLRRILMWTMLLSIVDVLLSAIAVRFWLIWLDVIYPLLAIWLLLVLLILLRRAFDRRMPTPAVDGA